MQNEQLRNMQILIEESWSGFSDLCDSSPVASLILSDKGCIKEAYLTASMQLCKEQKTMKKAWILSLLFWAVFLSAALIIEGCSGGVSDTGTPYRESSGWGGTAQTCSVSGTLRDIINNQPLQGATCTLSRTKGGNFIKDFLRMPREAVVITTATTDQNGLYRLTAIPAGTYTLTITRTDYITYEVNDLSVTGEITNVDHSILQTSQWNQMAGSDHPYDANRSCAIVQAGIPSKAIKGAGISAAITPSNAVQIGYISDAAPPTIDWNATATYQNGKILFYNLTPGVQYNLSFISPGTTFVSLTILPSSGGTIQSYSVLVQTPEPNPTTTPTPNPNPTPSPSTTVSPQPSPTQSPGGGGGGGGGGAPVAAKLSFNVQPTDLTAGMSITPPLEVAIQDASGNTVTTATGDITIVIDTNPSGSELSGTTKISAAAGVATFDNLSLDKAGEGYTLMATSGSLTAATSSTFNVMEATIPTVTLTEPANGDTEVALNNKITATFSEKMNPLTVNTATFTLKQGTTAVSGTVTYADLVATFTPDSNLAASTTFTAAITTGAKNLAGNALVADNSWSFTSLAWNYSAWSDQGIVYTAPAGDAYYPCVLYDTNGFEDADKKYAMWYSNGSGAVFLVTSSNGSSWSAPTAISGLGGDANHTQVLYDANHFGLGSSGPKYRIWYWDTGELYSISSIAAAQSDDGVNWVNDTALSQDASAKLVTGNANNWNYGSYGPISLFYQPDAANSGDDPWSYRYIMYYDGTHGTPEASGLAYSTDGLFWKAYSGNPVLSPSSSPAWDSNYSTFGTVYHDDIGFHFWYSGGVKNLNEGIGYAFSTDGKAWTRNTGCIFHISDAVSYRNKRVCTPSVVNDGTGVLKMYYTAQATEGSKKIGWAILSP